MSEEMAREGVCIKQRRLTDVEKRERNEEINTCKNISEGLDV